MITYVHKAKQYLPATLRVVILVAMFWFIYLRLKSEETVQIGLFLYHLTQKNHTLLIFLPLFLLLATLNWYFEILKWKTVVLVIKPITFKTAMRQSLASLTVSLATPNRIGEYGAKALFYKPQHRKKILILNFYSNFFQMAVTFFFGAIGIYFIVKNFEIEFSFLKIVLLSTILLTLIVFGFIFKKKQLLVKGFTLENVITFYKQLPTQLKLKTALFSVSRYIIFSSLFLFLLFFFNADISAYQAFPIIFSMYFLVSILPSIFIFDVVVRGGVAVWLFGLAGIPELPVLSTVLVMWLLNFVIPALWGSAYVIGFKKENIC